MIRSRSAIFASMGISLTGAVAIITSPSKAVSAPLLECSSYVQSNTIADGSTGCLATVGGITYTIKLTDQAYVQSAPINLTNPLGNKQPWYEPNPPASFGSSGALAYQIADAVGFAFGTFRYQASPEPGAPQKQFGGPLFAYRLEENNVVSARIYSNFNPSVTYPSVFIETDEYWTQHPFPGSLLSATGNPSFPTFRFAYAESSTAGPPPSSVPGPLPTLGLAAAFGFSRKLRKRIKASANSVTSTPDA